jgi:hypothetical protein
MNKREHLLTCLSEECGESIQVSAKANRFGLDHIWPEKGESNRRILEREIADILGVARELGLVIREEDIEAKREKLRKMMTLSASLGTLKDPEFPDTYLANCVECGKTEMVCCDDGYKANPRCRPCCHGKVQKAQ